MDLKSILSNREKKSSTEHYWALVIEPGWVQAGIWKIIDEAAEVVYSSPPTAWELESEMIEAADAALSSAIQNLPENIKEPSKTVFGVVSSWVAKGEIKEEHLLKIKKISTDLSLDPAGFVVLPEAIAHLYKSEEGSPLSAVVIGVFKEEVEISVFRLGNLVGTSQVARSVSVFDDLNEGLVRFASEDPIPSRFVLYDGKEGELKDVRQVLSKADWDSIEKIKFLHTPKIETINSKRKINAVSLAGASEIADVSTLKTTEKDQTTVSQEISKQEVENIVEAKSEVSANDLGFVLGKDVAKDAQVKENVPKKNLEMQSVEKIATEQSSVSNPKKTKLKFQFKFNKFLKPLKNLFVKLFSFKKSPKTKNLETRMRKRPLYIGGGIFLVILVSAFLFWWFYPKATVRIYVSTKQLDERLTIIVDPNAESADIDNKILPGVVLTETISGDKTKPTTGTKTVGEKSKGEVTIYRVGPELTLSSGTTITGPNDLKFNIDSDITVASGSAGTPGSTKTSVTASEIGAEFNLASSSTFSVSNYSTSDLEAKSESAFSGGTSREISAVSEVDQEELEEDLTAELEENVKQNLSSNLDEGQEFIDDSITLDVTSRDFSDKVGDEASTLKLTLDLAVTAIALDNNALNQLVKDVLENQIPSGFVLREDQIKVSFEYDKEVDGTYLLEASINANLLPEVNPDQVAQKIAGKYPEIAKTYLTEEVPGFGRAEIIFKPKLPGKLGTLPRVVGNIEVEIAADK